MLPRERRFSSVLLVLGLLALTRGQYGFTNAYAVWSSAPWGNPDTIELEEINARASSLARKAPAEVLLPAREPSLDALD